MIDFLYVIFDQVSELVMSVFVAHNHKDAIRFFNAALSSRGQIIDDYVLYCVGSFDASNVDSFECQKAIVVKSSSVDATIPSVE